jgi:hypothetical protein
MAGTVADGRRGVTDAGSASASRTWHQNGASSSAPSSLGCSGGSYNEGVRLAGKECGGGSNRAVDHSRATSAAR